VDYLTGADIALLILIPSGFMVLLTTVATLLYFAGEL